MASYRALGTVELKITQRYIDLLNHTTFSESVMFVFGFIKKCFCVACNDANHVPMEGLGLKPLRIHLESANGVYMWISLLMDDKFLLVLFYIVYNVQYQRVLLFEII